MYFDVFNGDADGICALLQLRLNQPLEATLITGVKRDIKLLDQVQAGQGDDITVLDVSLDKNISALERVLSRGASVFYVDHHQAANIPKHPQLKTLIDTDANTCTSLLVDQFLKGRFRAWAVTAAFGDNMMQSAELAAKRLSIDSSQLASLKELGVCMNYNGYGATLEDLLFSPQQLYKEVSVFSSPFEFMAGNPTIYEALRSGYYEDMAKAKGLAPDFSTDSVAVFKLPDAVWARRISGVFGNQLANSYPLRAHAILTNNVNGSYTVSVRAPLVNKMGADELCQQFPTGGGRKAAAGINSLAVADLDRFVATFTAQYEGQ